MKNLKINYVQYNEILNLTNGFYSPVKKFMNKNQIISVLNEYKINKKYFFPIPIHFNISKKEYKEISNKKRIKLLYKKKLIGELNVEKIFSLDKKKYVQKYFNTSSLKHQGVKNFMKLKPFFVSGAVKLSKLNRSPKEMSVNYCKNMFKKKNFNSVAGFHTRNIPHATHEFLHEIALKQCDALFINPMTGKLKKGDFKRNIIVKSYKIYLKEKSKKNIFFSEFLSFARFAGPREAAFHALVRKNLGCTHFIIGRDHAGIKDFYKKYESQNFCKKNEKKIGIKIIAIKEPFYCKKCRLMRSPENSCKHHPKYRKFLSGTEIRNFIRKKQSIPNYYLSKSISKNLKINSLR